jgi:hypothetical protein
MMASCCAAAARSVGTAADAGDWGCCPAADGVGPGFLINLDNYTC